MLYQAYLAHSDILLPVRSLASVAMRAIGQPLAGLTDNAVLRNLTAVYELVARAGLTHDRPPYRIDSTQVGNREVAVTEEAADVTPFGTLLHFKKDIDTAQPRVLLVAPLSGHFATLLRSTVRTHAARARRLHHRLAQCARRRRRPRPLRLRFLHRAPDPVPGEDRARRPRGGGLSALRRGAGRGRGDGAERQPGAAAQHDADGRTDRYPGQSDQGQRPRQLEADRVVRAEPDRVRAAALSRRACAASIRASSSSPPS